MVVMGPQGQGWMGGWVGQWVLSGYVLPSGAPHLARRVNSTQGVMEEKTATRLCDEKASPTDAEGSLCELSGAPSCAPF